MQSSWNISSIISRLIGHDTAASDSYLLIPVSVIAGLGLLIMGLKFALVSQDKIPKVGYPFWLGSYFGAVRFLFASQNLVQEGYVKYKSRVFKVPQFNHWTFIVSGEQLVDEFHKLPDRVLSLLDSAKEELQITYTMGSPIHTNPFHLGILRTKLPRHLDALIRETMDEILLAFGDGLHVPEGPQWTEIRALPSFEQLVARIFNRVLVGAPTCRDSRYLDLSLQFTIDTVLTSFSLNLLPKWLQTIAGPLLTRLPRTQRLAMKYLGPLIEERKRLQKEYGDEWLEKPNDILSWLMDEANGPEQETQELATRILVVNSATIHTSSMTFTQAIFNLASRPEYIEPLRQEAEEAIRLHGWNRLGMDELPKMDSFFKESIRLNGLGSIGFSRVTLQDHTFSDGTHVPPGTYISVALASTHLDESYYENAGTFNGYRFLGQSRGKHGMITTSTRYLPFGHGKHACPGRFIVGYVLKAMMCHLILHYDLRMQRPGIRPLDKWFSYACIPDRSANVLLRQRTFS